MAAPRHQERPDGFGDYKDLGVRLRARLGRAVMAAGITDPSLDQVREEEQEIADRMLNLQMQLRRMGGGRRVKQPSRWRKWIVLFLLALFMGGLITVLVLFGADLSSLISVVLD